MRVTKIILIICLLFFGFKALPQNNISVSHAYGKAEVVIPVFNLEVDGVQLPIFLKYNASGARCDKLPTAVGLNWELFVGGSIGREITYNPDEAANGIIQGGASDHFDKFYFESLFGSGQFNYLDGSFVYQINNNLVMDYDNPNSGGYLSYFQITDGVGNNFYFGDVDNPMYYNYRNQATVNTLREGLTDGELSPVGVSQWLINKIVTRNSQEINFNYTAYSPVSYSVTNYDLVGTDTYETLVTTYGSDVNLIESIESDNYYIEFTYSTDASLEIWEKKLVSVEVRPSQPSSVILKKVVFEYGKFTDNRLKLNSVTYLGDDNEEGDTYEFTYYDNDNAISPMLIGTQSKDYFGYYNGIDNSSSQPSGFNRGVNSTYITNMSLETITYPSGATATIYYEPNEGNTEYSTIYYCYYILGGSSDNLQSEYIIDASDASVADTIIITEEESGVTMVNYPGLRIKEIEIDNLNSKKYTYSEDVEYENGVFTYQGVKEGLYSPGASEASSEVGYYFEIDARGYPYLEEQHIIEKSDTVIKKVHFDYEHKARDGGLVSERDPYLLTRKTITEYFWDRFADPNMIRDDYEGTIVSVEDYLYNSNWLVSQIDYLSTSAIFTYSCEYDLLLDNSNYTTLESKNILAIPIGKKVIKSGTWAQGTISKLDDNGNPTEVYNIVDTTSYTSTPGINNTYYDLVATYVYNPSGLVTNIYTPNGDKKSFVRDSRDNLLAEVANAAPGAVYYDGFEVYGTDGNAKTGEKYTSRAQVQFFIPTGYSMSDFIVSYWYLESNEWIYKEVPLASEQFTISDGDGIDELRIFPKNASMVTYSYDDYDRVISSSDINNVTTWYEYDNFGRLSTIKDNNGYIRESYEYASKDEVAEISTSASTISFERAGESNSFQVTSDKDYTIETNNSWISINTGYMFGTQTIDVSCESNEGLTERSGALTISSHNTTEIVYISQDGPELSLSYPQGFISGFSPMGGNTSVDVDANFDDWVVSSNQEWLTVVKSGSEILIECAENEIQFGGVALITIDGRGSADATVEISQEGASISSVSPTSLTYGITGGTETSTVTANFDDWAVSDDKSWITTSLSGDVVSINVTSSNLNSTDRAGTVTISGRENTKTVSVTQTGVSLSLDKSSMSFDYNPTSSQSVSITSNYDWAISESSRWITTSKTSGSGNSTFTISCSTNSGSSSRSGTITVTSGNVTETITVTQECPELDYKVSGTTNPSSVTVDAASSTQKVYIYSNVDSWAVSDNASWITVSNSTGSGDGNATLNISSNTGSDSRTATITISSTYVTKTFTVTQTAESLTVSPTSISVGSSAGTTTFTITSNTSWAITERVAWLSVSQSSGSGNATIQVYYDQNTTPYILLGNIVVSGIVSSTTVKVTQDKSSGLEDPIKL